MKMYDYNKVKKIIESCDNKKQIPTAKKIANLFYKKYHNMDLSQKLGHVLRIKMKKLGWF